MGAVISVALTGLGCIAAGFAGQHLALAAASLCWRPRPVSGLPDRRLAVLIPAHDESSMIAGAVASVLAQDFPAELLQVVVVADNCTDDTADRARAAGATVLVRNDPLRRGKGWALRFGIEHLLALPDPPDGVVVIDADATVGTGFLVALEARLREGARVVQADDVVRAVPASSRSTLEATVIGMRNTVRLSGRKVLGIPAVLCGNGMLFSTEVLRAHPWGSASIVEDVEYGIGLRLAGIRPVFCREAKVVAAPTQSDTGAYTQALRWDGGRLELVRECLGAVVRSILSGRLDMIDVAVDLVSPSLALLGFCVVAGDAASIAALTLGWVGPEAPFAWGAATVFLAAYLALAPLLTASGHDAHLAILRQGPRFLVLKLRTYLSLALGHRPGGWVRTER